jgi:hypothetical protein
MPYAYIEDQLVEQPTIGLFAVASAFTMAAELNLLL